MPSSFRRVTSAISAWPPSWAIVIRPLDSCQDMPKLTIASATSAETTTTHGSGAG